MSGTGIYVRWKAGESRTETSVPEIGAGHPLAEWYCQACDDVLGNGAPVTMLVLGPGSDAELQQRHAGGRWYSAHAVPIHTACVGGGVRPVTSPREPAEYAGELGPDDVRELDEDAELDRRHGVDRSQP